MAQSLDLADYHGLGGGCAWRLSSRFFSNHVRYWHLADMPISLTGVQFWLGHQG
jgi:hypothetical protein